MYTFSSFQKVSSRVLSLIVSDDVENSYRLLSFADQVVKDRQREQYLQSLGLRVIRYINDDIVKNLDGVLEDLAERLSSRSTSPHPSLPRRGKKAEG